MKWPDRWKGIPPALASWLHFAAGICAGVFYRYLIFDYEPPFGHFRLLDTPIEQLSQFMPLTSWVRGIEALPWIFLGCGLILMTGSPMLIGLVLMFDFVLASLAVLVTGFGLLCCLSFYFWPLAPLALHGAGCLAASLLLALAGGRALAAASSGESAGPRLGSWLPAFGTAALVPALLFSVPARVPRFSAYQVLEARPSDFVMPADSRGIMAATFLSRSLLISLTRASEGRFFANPLSLREVPSGDLVFSPSGSLVAFIAVDGGWTRRGAVWPKERSRKGLPAPAGTTLAVRNERGLELLNTRLPPGAPLAFSHDESGLYYFEKDAKHILLIDLHTQERRVVHDLSGIGNPISQVFCDTDCQNLATIEWVQEKHSSGVRFWSSGAPQQASLFLWNPVSRWKLIVRSGLLVSLDRLFTGRDEGDLPDREFALIDLHSGETKILAGTERKKVYDVAVSPRGDLLAAATDESILLYRLPSLQPAGALRHGFKRPVAPLAISSVERLLVGASESDGDVNDGWSKSHFILQTWDLDKLLR